jgi:RNA polymerase sigma-70 factor (ECF subfamily)
MSLAEDDWKARAEPLLRAAQAGDAAARGRLFELYRNYLTAIAEAELTNALRPKAGASDVVQDTLLEAHNFFARFEGEEGDGFRAWLRGILMNKLAQVHAHYHDVQKRQVDREQPLEQSGDTGQLLDGLVAADPTPSGQVVRDEEEQLLHNVLAQLPEPVRQVILWRNWEGQTFAEIGRRLGRSEDAARMFFTRALETLAERLGAPDAERRPNRTE